jgi:hypothetical protein
VAIAFLVIPGAMALGLACLGLASDDSPGAAVATVLYTWFTSGMIAVAFFLAAIGFGWPVSRLLATSDRDRYCLQPAAGLATLLFVDHLVGVAGGFSGGVGRIGAIAVFAVGIGLLAVQGSRVLKGEGGRPRMPRAPWSALLGCASVAVLLVAACNPPGVLWRSEAGGFDAMSYHLPLAQEWAGGTRIWPLQHNVYSFLPSYAEAGFTQVAALCGGNLVTGDGLGVLACQLVHVGQTLIAAFTIGALAAAVARRCGIAPQGATLGGGLAFAAVLGVPWTVVTGSLAYNEMAAVGLSAGAMLAAVSDGPAWKRGLGAGLLLGAAAACKPTFLFMAGPTVGLLLLTSISVRQWVMPLLAGVLGGVVMLAPPLARNWAACGNPVFPLSTAMGTAHWTPEQAARFHKAHGRDGAIGEQAARLFSPVAEPGAFNGEPRGVMHSQWAMMFPVCGGAAVLLMLRRETRKAAAVLTVGVAAGFAFWIAATHGQSRFLMPLLPNLACALGVLAAWLVGDGEARPPLRRLSLIFACVMPLIASAAALRLFLTENHAHPNEWLTRGVSEVSGEALAARFDSMTLDERRQIQSNAPPTIYSAVMMRDAGDKLFLLGDATPLYFTVPLVYSTTWDRSVLGEAMAKFPDEPAAWTRAIQKTGATYILINDAEIARYRRTYGFDDAITPERLASWTYSLGEPVNWWPKDPNVPAQVRLYEVPAEKVNNPPRAPKKPTLRNGA